MAVCMEIPFEFSPGWDWVLIRPVSDPTILPGKVVRVGGGAPLNTWGEVVEVGPSGMAGTFLPGGGMSPLEVSVGDVVYFNSAASTKIQKDGVPMYLVQDQYCMMRVDSE